MAMAALQLPNLLGGADSDTFLLGLGVISLFVVMAIAVTPIAIRNYRKVAAYAAAHPHPRAPLPNRPDQP